MVRKVKGFGGRAASDARDILRAQPCPREWRVAAVGGWDFPGWIEVGHEHAIPDRPDPGPIGDLEEISFTRTRPQSFWQGSEATSGLGMVPAVQIRVRAGTGRLFSKQTSLLVMLVTRVFRRISTPLCANTLPGISPQTFTWFRQDHRPGMNEHDAQHPLARIRIEWQRLAREVVQRGNRFPRLAKPPPATTKVKAAISRRRGNILNLPQDCG